MGGGARVGWGSKMGVGRLAWLAAGEGCGVGGWGELGEGAEILV